MGVVVVMVCGCGVVVVVVCGSVRSSCGNGCGAGGCGVVMGVEVVVGVEW